jgi:hypothetical protein
MGHPVRVDVIAYAQKNNLWVRGWPDPTRELIERDWRPRMYGTITITEAVKKLVADTTAVQSRQ